MKRRLVLSFLGVTTVVLVLLALPMGYLLLRVATEEAHAQVTQQATYLLGQVLANEAAGEPQNPTELGNLLAPDTSAVVELGSNGRVEIRPRPSGEVISESAVDPSGVKVTVFISANPVRDRARQPLIILAGLGAAGLLTTWLLAQAEARRLGQPLRELVTAAARLGSGDFSVTAPRSGIPELDSLATTLDASAERIDALVRAERRFNSDAGHQLRSALTGLRLRLEELTLTDDPEITAEAAAALEQADRLSATIDDLLKLSRTGRAGVATRFDLRTLVANHASDIAVVLDRSRRQIRTAPGPVLFLEAAQGAVGQALDVLFWNAAIHGRGTVSVELATSEGWVEITVSDEGTMDPALIDTIFLEEQRRGSHGIGLPLARRVIEAEGGTLDVASTKPTKFRVKLPIL